MTCAAGPRPAIVVLALLWHLNIVFGQYAQQKDCTILQPDQCDLLVGYSSDGSTDFSSCQESCTNHTCALPQLSDSAFCGTELLNYPARLSSGGQLPLGQAEDKYAACLYSNWAFSLQQGDCRYVQLWTCADCATAYKRWLCGTVFQRCSAGDPESRVLMCRDTCFDVVRKCPVSNTGFTCPLDDARDYAAGLSMPSCNPMSLPRSQPPVPRG